MPTGPHIFWPAENNSDWSFSRCISKISDWNPCLARFGRKTNTEKMVKPSNISSSFCITNQMFTFMTKWNCSIALSKQLNLSDTERPLIYSFMLIATAQLNDCVFVSSNCQQLHNEISKQRRCWFVPETLQSVFLISANGWQASSCECSMFATAVL